MDGNTVEKCGGGSRIGDRSATFRQRRPSGEQLLDRDVGAALQLLRRQRRRQRRRPLPSLRDAVAAALPLRRTRTTSASRCNSQFLKIRTEFSEIQIDVLPRIPIIPRKSISG